MKLNNLLEDIKYLCEIVRKQGDKYFIFSHKTGKKLGKKEGYSSLRGAVGSMMIIASHGGFAKNPNKSKLINNYIKRHNLNEWYWHEEDEPKRSAMFYGTATRDKSEKSDTGNLVTWKKGDELQIYYSFNTEKYEARTKGGLLLRIIKKDFERDESKPYEVWNH